MLPIPRGRLGSPLLGYCRGIDLWPQAYQSLGPRVRKLADPTTRTLVPVGVLAAMDDGMDQRAISAASARKSSCVWVMSQTPCTSVYSISAEPCRWARSAK